MDQVSLLFSVVIPSVVLCIVLLLWMKEIREVGR